MVKGICPECKVRNGDDSEKELFKCPLCGRDFCSDHLDPKLAFFSASFNIPKIKDPQYREQLMKERKKENAHPCIPYTIKRLNELDQERRLRLEKISKALDKSRFIKEVKPKEKSVYSKAYKQKKRPIAKKLAIVCIFLLAVIYLFYASPSSIETVVKMLDFIPPSITIISPEPKIYNTSSLVLNYTVSDPVSWIGYCLNNSKNVTLTGNTTLSNISPGRYNLVIYANDTAGNMGSSNVSFIITRIFRSLNELIIFLREDDLSDKEWTANYTCAEFAQDFIRRAENKGYYCFAVYDLWNDELDKFNKAVETIKVIKKNSWGTETREYIMFTIPGVGHAVVRTSINGMDGIIDPQTDIILSYPDFTVLYEGEIAQD